MVGCESVSFVRWHFEAARVPVSEVYCVLTLRIVSRPLVESSVLAATSDLAV